MRRVNAREKEKGGESKRQFLSLKGEKVSYPFDLAEYDVLIYFLCHGAEELVLDQCDIESFLPLEGVVPFAPDSALV